MRKKLLTTYLLILSVTIMITILFSWNRVNDHFYDEVERESAIQITLIKQILSHDLTLPGFDFQQFTTIYGQETDLRITVIDSEGVVLGDSSSDPSTMENHKNRSEFRAALRGNEETSLRYSNTLGQYFYYYAVPLDYPDFDGALRVSKPAESIQSLIWDMVGSVFFGLFIGSIFSFVIAYLFSRRFMQPIDELTKTARLISKGEYDNKVYIDDPDQIGELADAFNTMTFTLRKTLYDTEYKNSELEAILTSMDTGLAAIDENYRIILSNEPFQELLHIEGEITNKIFYEVTRNPHIFGVIERSLEDDEYVIKEMNVGRGLEQLILKVSATPIKNKANKKIRQGVLIAVEDVTNLRKLETMRSDFVSNVTHELKTPLTSIKGFVEVLKEGAIDDQASAKRFLDIIDIESDRLTILIEDILSLSEIESMRLDKNTGNHVIGNIVTEVKEILDGKAKKKNIAIVLNLQEDLPIFKCNRDRIKQLFINLIDNSIKYTDTGSVTVECKESRDKAFLVIKVIDTGIGIEEEHLERLFERFYRVDKGRSRNLGGTGLGLSIVKHIAELYHGTVDVKSVYGTGTTMKIRLPYNN